MTKVKACKSCGVMVEINAILDKNNSKVALTISKCPLCSRELTEDDSENYES